ncbi:DUF6636 domain-containing protein [Actinoplanes sp. NPDC051475]|uniref:DUF6636 domain-containing protein n=1 Tax=Actinoplanes sp. NPDC051475 TaxID=3157225 RepID=UPI00344D1F46
MAAAHVPIRPAAVPAARSRALAVRAAFGARVRAVVVVVAIGAAVAACSSPSGTRADSRVTPTAAANAGLGNAPSPSASARVVTEAAFASPSGNIGCYLSDDGARCDIAKKSWSPGPAPADCELDWGFGVAIGKSGKANFTCAGDTVLGAKDRLEYGRSLKAGDFQCDSASTGMRCQNEKSGHGFTVAKEQYDFF